MTRISPSSSPAAASASPPRGGNDSLFGGAGNDLIDGGGDIDTARFADALSAYDIVAAGTGNQWTVTHTASGETDTVIDVEFFRFADVTISVADL